MFEPDDAVPVTEDTTFKPLTRDQIALVISFVILWWRKSFFENNYWFHNLDVFLCITMARIILGKKRKIPKNNYRENLQFRENNNLSRFLYYIKKQI